MISFHGRATPARRLLWQLKYQNTPQYLEEDQRLQNLGCQERSICMNLLHWHKREGGVRAGLGAVRAILSEAEVIEPGEAKWCRSGKHLRDAASRGNCPACDQQARNQHTQTQRLSYAVGRAIRQQVRPPAQAEEDEDV